MSRAFVLVALLLAVCVTVSTAFMTPAPLALRTGSQQVQQKGRAAGNVVMACRFNAKREKRKRNGENARKYRMKNTGPKYLIIKTRKRASKAEYSKRLEQYEMDFTAQIFQVQDIDSLLAGASDGGDA
ncbi:hypothetical protein NSK_004240 [Nannochloropsis salina CCMP1776]|uniref:Uncharacterized protein n=1 Tax=Nannochloropsis salina CCMP1776 TaxID=1027361 RepID=A0A4D9D6P2_9STRA|nr:hypothetical protein NSK_004240 [Nannochloropsis salina CCMP1776]|eukprot:TFJ84249.1 hypothetical protein NSK_004240 [Nannochloropsis salina CCMP1776]